MLFACVLYLQLIGDGLRDLLILLHALAGSVKRWRGIAGDDTSACDLEEASFHEKKTTGDA